MHQTLWPEHDFQGATGLMCISLRLKTNLGWHIFFWGKLFYVPTAQLNATVCSFADIISLRRRHNSFGTYAYLDGHFIEKACSVN